MHPEAYDYCLTTLETHFGGSVPTGLRVVEFGSRDVNGSVRDIFPSPAEYLGIDYSAGDGVDLVTDAAEWVPADEDLYSYDVFITTEVFEHTPRWPEMLMRGRAALVDGGIAVITCATAPREPHSAIDGFELEPDEYYQNVNPDDLVAKMEEATFLEVTKTTHPRGDLYARAVAGEPPSFESDDDDIEAGDITFRGILEGIDGSDIVPNSTFESGTTGWVATNDSTLASETTEAHGGTKSLKITSDVGWFFAGAETDAFDDIPVEVGKFYRFGAWFKSDEPNQADLRVQYLTDVGGDLGTSILGSVNIDSTDWRHVEKVVEITDENVAFVRIVFEFFTSDDSGGVVFYADDVTCAKVSTAVIGALQTGEEGARVELLNSSISFPLGEPGELAIGYIGAGYLDAADPDDRHGYVKIAAPSFTGGSFTQPFIEIRGKTDNDDDEGYIWIAVDGFGEINLIGGQVHYQAPLGADVESGYLVPQFTDFDCVVSQGASTNRSLSTETFKHHTVGQKCELDVYLVLSQAGSAGSAITVSVPFPFASWVPLDSYINPLGSITGTVHDSGAAVYPVQAVPMTGQKIGFVRTDAPTAGGLVGAAPSYALASGDSIRFSGWYPLDT